MHYIDSLIVFGFLSITLIVGLALGGTNRTVSDYALGGRNFSTSTLVSTIVATIATGSLFTVGLTQVYKVGLYDLIPILGISVSMIFTAYLLVPKMSAFMGNISIAESIGNLYGAEIRVITAFCSIIANIGAIAVQFKVFGSVMSYFSDIDSLYSIVLAGVIITIYSSFGGIRSVAFTDVMQLLTFGIVIPMIGIVIWMDLQLNTNVNLMSNFDDKIFSVSQIFNVYEVEFWSMLAMVFYFTVPSMQPAFYQRIIMGRDVNQAKRAFLISAAIIFLVIIFVAWIPFLLKGLNLDLEANELLPYLIDRYSYTGFKGLLIAAVMAMCMSSADSFINVASVLFTNDICKPFGLFKSNELLITRAFAVSLGVAGIFLATQESSLFQITLTVNSFYMPVISMPLLFSLLGFRTTTKSVLIGMIGGIVTVLIWRKSSLPINDIAPGMIVNALFMFGSHYLLKQKGGWVKNYDTPIEVKPSKKGPFGGLSGPIFTDIPKSDNTYILFGVFSFILTISTIYLTHDKAMSKYADILVVTYALMLVISTLFMFYIMWGQWIKKQKFVAVIWNLSVMYMLVFCSSFFVLLSNLAPTQLIIFTLSLMVLFNVTNWRTAVIMVIAGCLISSWVFQYSTGINSLDLTFGNEHFNLIYILLVITTAIITFLKPKQEYLELTEARVNNLTSEVTFFNEKLSNQEKEIVRLSSAAQRVLRNVNHELRLPVGNVKNFSEMLHEGFEKYDPETLKELTDEVYKNSTRLSTMILNMLDLANLDVKHIDLERSIINFSETVKDRVQTCCNVYLNEKPLKFKLVIEPDILIDADANYIRQVVDNLVINSINFSSKGTIEIKVFAQEGKVYLTIKDEGIGIPPEDIYDIFAPFQVSSKSESKAEGRGVGLALCKSAVEAHGGSIVAESGGSSGAMFTVILPIIKFNKRR